jgi:hypothetical protein
MASRESTSSRAARASLRELQRRLRAQGVKPQHESDETPTRPASFIAVDPDGNPILVDREG